MLLMAKILCPEARDLHLCSRRIPAEESRYPWGLLRAPQPADRSDALCSYLPGHDQNHTFSSNPFFMCKGPKACIEFLTTF